MCRLLTNVCMLHFIFSSLCFTSLFYVSGVVFKNSPTYPWIVGFWYSSVFYYRSCSWFCSKHCNSYCDKRTTINMVYPSIQDSTPNYIQTSCYISSIKVRKMGHSSDRWNRPLTDSNCQFDHYNSPRKWPYIIPCYIFCVHTSIRWYVCGTALCDSIVHRGEKIVATEMERCYDYGLPTFLMWHWTIWIDSCEAFRWRKCYDGWIQFGSENK